MSMRIEYHSDASQDNSDIDENELDEEDED